MAQPAKPNATIRGWLTVFVTGMRAPRSGWPASCSSYCSLGLRWNEARLAAGLQIQIYCNRKYDFMKPTRALSMLLVFLLCTSVLTFPASAVIESDGFDINYWYSDSDAAGTWATSTIPVFVSSNLSTPSLSESNIESYVSTAFNSWSCTGISHYISSSGLYSKICILASSRSEATINHGLPSDAIGATSYSRDLVGSLYYRSSEKSHYIINSANIILVECAANSSTSGAKKTTVHEIGHALGCFGHYENGNIMTTLYENMSSLTPSTNEQNHLGQLY